jgi:hypothetical protein
MTEKEKAIVRACMAQTELALCEARGVGPFWNSLGSDLRMRWSDFQCDVHAILIGLREPVIRPSRN